VSAIAWNTHAHHQNAEIERALELVAEVAQEAICAA
jgi:hypothetical protein